jgi:hypothetical protein
MRNFPTIILLLICSLVRAQSFDWYPVRPAQQLNYVTDTEQVQISRVIKIDSSSSINGITWHFLNRIVTPCDTCKNQDLANDPYDSTYALNSQPQFLKRKFAQLQPGLFYFCSPASYVITINKNPGYSWLFDSTLNITATILSKQQQNIFGSMDSVMNISLSSGDTIVLSKNNGFTQFPVSNSTRNYRLSGTEGIQSQGAALKRFHDFFNFSAGDVIQYSLVDDDGNFFPPKIQHGHERWQFFSVNNYPDSVVCHVQVVHYDSVKYGASPPYITSYTHTERVAFYDSSTHFANAYPQQEISVWPFFPYPYIMKEIHHCQVSKDNLNRDVKFFGENCPNFYLTAGHTAAAAETAFPNVFLNRNTRRIVGRELTEGFGITSELYNDYDRIIQKCMIGYIKGSDTSGTIIGPLNVGINEYSLANNVSVYPVPAGELITVPFCEGLKSFCLRSITGELIMEGMLREKANTAINIELVANGVYLLTLSGTQRLTKKIIVRH